MPFLLLLSMLLLSSCSHYPRKIDAGLRAKVNPSTYSASLSIIERTTRNAVIFENRKDNSSEASSILEIVHHAGLFKSEDLNFENYLDPQNLVIDVEFETIVPSNNPGNNFWGFAVFIPFPETITTLAKWSVRSTRGLLKTYNAKIEVPRYSFFLFWPIAITQAISLDSNYALRLATQDIITQINADLSSGQL
jgi:hypothetical protein